MRAVRDCVFRRADEAFAGALTRVEGKRQGPESFALLNRLQLDSVAFAD